MKNKEAVNWVRQEKWNTGNLPALHPSADPILFYEAYGRFPERWKAAFDFLKRDFSNCPVGRYPVMGKEVFATVDQYVTKLPEDARWEAHRRYIDLQYVVDGREQMQILPLNKAVDPGEYDAERDLIFYGANKGECYVAGPLAFFLFFPQTLHRPGLMNELQEPVKKIVLKIACA